MFGLGRSYGEHKRATGAASSGCVSAAYMYLLKLSAISGTSLLPGRRNLPVLITHSPSSLTRTHELASSNSKSCSSSTRFEYSASFLRLRFRFRASHSGSGLAVSAPAMVYMGIVPLLLSFILTWWTSGRCVKNGRTKSQTLAWIFGAKIVPICVVGIRL